MADVVAIGLRAAASAAALQAAGLPIFVLLYGDLLDRASRQIRSTILPTTLVAVAVLSLHALVEPVRLTGAWSGLLDPSLHALLLSSDFGTTLAMRAVGLISIAASTRSAGRSGTGFAIAGATLIAASFTFMGHTAADPERWLLAPLLLLHASVIAFWFGSLWPLLTVTRLETAEIAGAVIGQFSRTAVWVVPLIFLAGLAMSALLLPGLSSLGTPYGILLLTKIGGFSILMALAGLNKWRLAPGISRGNRVSVSAFRVSLMGEWVVILAIVTITSVMTALFSPD